MKRALYHHGDLANALVREARLLVEANGPEAFSLREAATRCGVAVGSASKRAASTASTRRRSAAGDDVQDDAGAGRQVTRRRSPPPR
jgi:hypothetical protein